MSNATTTPTEMTVLDKYRILEGLYTVAGLGEYITRLTIETRNWSASEFAIHDSDTTAEGRALLRCYDLFAPATVDKRVLENYDHPSIHVYVRGDYWGVPVNAYVVVFDEAARDRVRDLDPGRDLLIALADCGPVPTPAEVRDQIWASCGPAAGR
jgi:hypothetical protein